MSRRSFIGSVAFWNKQIVRATRKQPAPAKALLERCIRPVLESLEQRTLLSADPAWQLDTALPYLPDTPLAPAPVLPQGVMAAGLTVPILHSNPSAAAKIYLDFDGYAAMTWGTYSVTATPAYSIDADTANFSATELANIQEIWERVSEKYSMFNVDVTTQDPGNLNNLQTVAAVIGGSGSWLGAMAGGVAYISAFSNSSPNQVWIFPNNLAAGAPKPVGEATAHEVGHAFGLLHQSQYSGTTKIAEYHPGDAYRAPIMGNSYSAARGMWWNGPSSTSSTSIQDDLSILAGATNGFGYRADDVGSTTSTAGTLTYNGGNISASGVIGSTSDADWFVLDIPYTGPVSITLSTPRGAMLDSTLGLNFSDGSSWFTNDGNGTTEYLGGTLNAGRYYLVVRSHGGYGDIGQYSISGTVPVGPLPNAPSGVTASAISTTQIAIAWVDTSSDEVGFQIERSLDGVTWTQAGTVGANVTSFSDTGLAVHTTYYYRVSSYSTWGAFNPGSIVTATTLPSWQDGQLDPTFGTGGIVTSDFGATEYGNTVLIQPDGKILVGGSTGDGGGPIEDFLLVRYNVDGTLDTTFGTGGKVITDWGARDRISSLALQADGKIIAVGSTGIGAAENYAVARYTTSGALDTTFGSAGKVSTDFFAYGDFVRAVLIQSDGRIVVVGTAMGVDSSKFGLVRYNTNGTLDTTFDGDGKVTTDILTNVDNAMDAVLQSDGKIIVVGKSTPSGGTAVFSMARYNTNGSLDTSFGGGDGMVTTDFAAGSATANTVALQGSKIVVGGLANYNFAFARYNSDGSPDTAFGTLGTTVIPGTTGFYNAMQYGMAVQADGRIVFAGYDDPSGGSVFAVVRLNVDGSPDYSFGTAGLVRTTIGFTGSASDVAIQKDGRIVLAGDAFAAISGDTSSVTVVRYIAQVDGTVPLPPTGLVAATTSTTAAGLTWVDTSQYETGFAIERSTNGTTWTQIATVAANSTSYVDTSAAAQFLYYYRLRAYNAIGYSLYSNTSTVRTLINAPTALAVTPISDTTIRLNWTDNSSQETGFKIERSTDQTTWTQIATVAAGTTTYTATALTGVTTYYFRVRAYTGTVNSLYTDPGSATTYALPTPTGLMVYMSYYRTVRVQWMWSGPSTIEGFQIWEKGPADENYSVVATVAPPSSDFYNRFYDRSGLEPNTTYSYYVTAFSAAGSSALPGPVTITTTYKPAAPSDLVATPLSNYEIHLSWVDNSANEENFSIQRSWDGGTTWYPRTIDANLTAFTDTGLAFGTTYIYRMYAYVTGEAHSDYSNLATATTFSNPPVAPTALTATAISTSRIDLAWTDNSSDETAFKIERSADGGVVWTQINTVGAGVKTYSDNTGLSAGVAYSYRVSADNGAATSAPTNVATATTWAATPPTGVIATVVSSTSIRVNWVDASNNETGFKIEASTNGGTTWSQVGTAPANAITATVTGLTGNTAYRFRVKAYTSLGDSPASTASASVTTTYLPPAPSALTATVISNYQINLAWTDNSANESGFRIERSSDGGSTWTQIVQVAANTRTYANTGLTFGTTYSYRVRGYNSTNENGAWSNTISATTFSNPPIAPTLLTATVISATQINLAWSDNSSDETGFKIERSTDGGTTWTQIGTVLAGIKAYNNTGLSPGTAYSYRVLAYSAAATSVPTNTVTATTWAAMPPTTVTATVLLSTSIRVNWVDASNNETGFILEASTNGGTTWSQVATPAANATTYTLTGLTPNTSYRFRLRATNALGESPNSTLSTAVTTTYLPAAPSALTATVISNYQINLAWNDNSANESGFRIERSTDGGATWTQIAQVAANIRTYANTGLTFGTSYSYRVRGYNATAENGSYSNVISATTFSNPPVAPTLLTATVVSTSQINLAWTDNSSDETGFKIERSSDGGTTWTQIGTVAAGIKAYNNTGLSPGTAYSYRVLAYNTPATSAPTNTATGTTWAAMPPTTVTATVLLSTSIRINWTDASNNEESFILWEKGPWAGIFVAVATLPANTTSSIRTGLTPNTLYSYYLTAANALGQSPNSPTAPATTTYLPAAPSALTATVISNYQINLAWNDNSANESGFRVERSSDGGTTWTQIGTTLANARTYASTGLTFGTTYSYRVRGYNSTNENGAWSNTISATTFSNPPAVPTGLSATVASTTQINLAWTDNSSDETGFNIQQSTDGGVSWVKIATAAANARTYNVTGLSPGTSYGFRVRSANAAATSAPSNAVTASTWAAMPPTTVTATVLLSTSIRVNWVDASNNEESFKLEQSSDAGLTWTLAATPAANTTSYTLTGLVPNTAYRYRLRASNALGESPNSAVASATTTYLPAAPTALSAGPYSAAQINLAWTDNSANEGGFKIERSSDGGATWSVIATTAANVRSYASTGLSAASSYHYRVRAVNTTNEYSPYSNIASALTMPATPTGLTATALAGGQIRLNWANLAGESGYLIERSLNGTTWTQIASLAADSTTYTNTGLTAGTRYYYRIRAYNPSGNGSYSSTVNLLAIA